ncbi:MAG: CRTAC1 family protein [Pseudomonadota bacterium]|nr:CRTAC1 family protein [Pseudomonadota bacterium]
MLNKKLVLPSFIHSIFLSIVLFIGGCGHDDDNDDSSVPTLPVELGITFSNESELLEPWARGPGEGYGGIAWLDYDLDDDLDMMLTNSKNFSNALMRNNGDGTFTDVTVSANALVTTGSSGIVVGDIDNDGYPDIFMSGSGFFSGPSQSQTVLLHNQGNGTFVDIAPTANVPGSETALSAAMGDINNDGFLDLFITAEGHLSFRNPAAREQHEDVLYLNNGDLTFTDITDSAGVQGGLGSCATSFSHFDDDEFLDLFVAICNDVNLAPTAWHVYKNNGDNTFTDLVSTTGGLSKLGFWMSSTFGDIDNDGDLDIFSTNLGGNNTHALFRNNGDGTYVDIADDEMAFNFWAWGATFADFDNDTYQDLIYGGELPTTTGPGRGNPTYLFMNNGNSRFTQKNDDLGVVLTGYGVTGISRADYDGDGFVDVAFMASLPGDRDDAYPILLRNEGNNNTWLSIRLEGTESNRMAIGARIEIISSKGEFQMREIQAGSSFVSSESPWPVFGLGNATSATATVYWPSGLAESFNNLSAGRLHLLTEGTGSSF